MQYRIASPQSVMEAIAATEGEKCAFPSPSGFQIEKTRRVQECLDEVPVSLWELRELALSKGGLINGMLKSRDDSFFLFSVSRASPSRRHFEEKRLAPFSGIAKHQDTPEPQTTQVPGKANRLVREGPSLTAS